MDLSLGQKQHRNAILKEANRVIRAQAAVNFSAFCAHRLFRKVEPKDTTRLPGLKRYDRYAYYFTLSERLKPGEIQRTVLLRTGKFRWDRKWIRNSVEVKVEGQWEGLSWWLSQLPMPCPKTTYLGDRGYEYMAQWWKTNRKVFPWAKLPEELRVMIVEFKEALEDPLPNLEELAIDDVSEYGSDDSTLDRISRLLW